MKKEAMAELLKETLEIGFNSSMVDFSRYVSITEDRLNTLVNGEDYPKDYELKRLNFALSDVEFFLEEEDNDIRIGTKNIIRRIILENLRHRLFDE